MAIRNITSEQSTDIYEYSFIDIEEKKISLASFKGKKLMFVNVASKCAYTPQYEKLQKLHSMYKDKLVIIGFPSNQFLMQEKGTEEEIKVFCAEKYGVNFLMSSKIDVKGKNQHPIYQWLTVKKLNNVKRSKVRWNFNKFIVDEKGILIGRFKSKTNPLDNKIISIIES